MKAYSKSLSFFPLFFARCTFPVRRGPFSDHVQVFWVLTSFCTDILCILFCIVFPIFTKFGCVLPSYFLAL